MSNEPNQTWGTERDSEGSGDLLRAVRPFLYGIGIGLVAGMSSFGYNMAQFVTIGSRLVVVPTIVAGGLAYPIARSLGGSVKVAAVGYAVGVAVLVIAWIAPVWILPYSSRASWLLVVPLAGDAITAGVISYTSCFLGGYLATVSLSALWE